MSCVSIGQLGSGCRSRRHLATQDERGERYSAALRQDEFRPEFDILVFAQTHHLPRDPSMCVRSRARTSTRSILTSSRCRPSDADVHRRRSFAGALSLVVSLSVIGLSLAVSDAAADEPATLWHTESRFEVPTHEWLDDSGPVRALVYSGVPFRGQPTQVFAYYATPGTLAGDPTIDRDLPAVVLVYGGGGTAFREWAELWAGRGYAAIAMDLAGHRPLEGLNPHDGANRERLEAAGPDQSDDTKFGRIDEPLQDQWSFHAVAAVIRAHSLIRRIARSTALRQSLDD